MAAVDEPVGTLKRVITNWGFSHAIKLDQGQALPANGRPEGALDPRTGEPRKSPCWEIIDVYGPMSGIHEDYILTDEQMDAQSDRWETVYTPVDDQEWAKSHGLKGTKDPDFNMDKDIV